MGLFRNKPKVRIEDCCRDFYNSQIFKVKTSVVFDKDLWSYYLSECQDSISEVDQAFSVVDRDSFWHEMTALRMEVFGLECSLRVRHKIDLALRQIFFTKHYLEENGRKDIWDTMHNYRKVIADSIFAKANGELVDGSTRLGRGKTTFWNVFKSEAWEKYIENHIADPQSPTNEEKEKLECLASALMRIGADIKRADCILVKMLAYRLTERLGCYSTINREAKFQIASIVFGLCAGVENHLKSVALK